MLDNIPIIINFTISIGLGGESVNMLIFSSMFIEQDAQNFDEQRFDSNSQWGNFVAIFIPW